MQHGERGKVAEYSTYGTASIEVACAADADAEGPKREISLVSSNFRSGLSAASSAGNP